MFRHMTSTVAVIAMLILIAMPLSAQDAAKKDAGKDAAAAKAELTVDQVVDRANKAAYYQGADGRAKVSMTITDDQGRERTREFTILRRDDPPPKGKELAHPDDWCQDQKMYVYFHRPADVNKMVFMVWKRAAEGALDDRWLYLPGLDLVKRIAAGDKRTSFVGSHFFYEDVSGRNIADDVHVLKEVAKDYYVLENTPKKPDEVEFSRYVVWIHKGSFLSVKTEYYDKQGKKYREYSALKVENIQGHHTVTKSVMKDLKGGGRTVLEYSDVKYDLELPEDIFTERYLRRAPVRYLR